MIANLKTIEYQLAQSWKLCTEWTSRTWMTSTSCWHSWRWKGWERVTSPGRYWVEYFPVLQHIPRWFPGTGFRKVAEKFRPYVENMTFKPFDDVIQAMVSAFTSIYPATSFMSVALSSKKGTLVHLWRAHWSRRCKTLHLLVKKKGSSRIMWPEIHWRLRTEVCDHVLVNAQLRTANWPYFCNESGGWYGRLMSRSS